MQGNHSVSGDSSNYNVVDDVHFDKKAIFNATFKDSSIYNSIFAPRFGGFRSSLIAL